MILPCRTVLFVNSCVPSLISLWNSLPLNVRYLPTISSFKREISNFMFQTNTVPSYFSYGTRYLSVIHARLRNNYSDLKTIFFSIIYLVIIVVTCNQYEDAEHYLFKCSRYRLDRLYLFNTLRDFHSLNCNLLLRGNPAFSSEANISIFDTVQKYISATGLFRVVIN